MRTQRTVSEVKLVVPMRPRRLLAIDIARSIALVAMILFHLAWDLTMFGFLSQDTMQATGWKVFARIIAGSFLFLSGICLWLAHADGIRWRSFLRRLSILVLAATAVSLATRLAMPQAWVRFGILHAIALSTTAGLLFLQAPVAVLALAAIVSLLLGRADWAVFDDPVWLWTGLGGIRPRMLDYEPIFPWLGVCLFGLLFARLFADRWQGLTELPGKVGRILSWPGRNSLSIYLLHQPILFGAVWMADRVLH
ncbi:heparan-alpha-glucosaminide N-acetyltransferase [Sedimentitalea sp. JM2-8]|uniref:Heparan-alpha-glucosaminide N-acetyltransferase n=1 Tax=Sedimentitalea xiamensis TaxID=3050037 RepID=A0ABT7FJG2_9RHOB|nr:heparan-alpha-glucosaminide N-acetyltransferase [Sedimentitalea xiamensis]MDK3075289.1 heparan-alpha-glucosaminide N-acetyltransferase [Sedimentitalea xiamensis]